MQTSDIQNISTLLAVSITCGIICLVGFIVSSALAQLGARWIKLEHVCLRILKRRYVVGNVDETASTSIPPLCQNKNMHYTTMSKFLGFFRLTRNVSFSLLGPKKSPDSGHRLASFSLLEIRDTCICGYWKQISQTQSMVAKRGRTDKTFLLLGFLKVDFRKEY